MSVQLKHDLSSLDLAAANLKQIGDINRRELLDVVGAEVESQTRRRIKDEKTDPDGSAWKELSPEYKKRKDKESSGGLLEFQGDLLRSIEHQLVNGHAVGIGSNLVYAAKNNEQRQYLGLSNENEQDINAVALDFIEDHLIRIQRA